MKKLWVVVSLVGIAPSLQATKFKVTNKLNQDELPVLFVMYHENQNGSDCNKQGKLLPHGKTTEIISAKYKKWGLTKECGVKSIEIVTQDNNGKQTRMFSATANELEAHAMEALTTKGASKGWKSSGDRYTGYFEIMMDGFDIELV